MDEDAIDNVEDMENCSNGRTGIATHGFESDCFDYKPHHPLNLQVEKVCLENRRPGPVLLVIEDLINCWSLVVDD